MCGRNYMRTAENFRMKFTVLLKAVSRIYRTLLAVTLANDWPCIYPVNGSIAENGIGLRSYLES